MIDILFINSNSPSKIYQELSKDFSAIEPPTWSLLLAEACRSHGHSVAILDCDAEKLEENEALSIVKYLKPTIAAFPVHGSNPNSSTCNMYGNLNFASLLKTECPEIKTWFTGTHVNALPNKVIQHPSVDFISINEGVKCLLALAKTDLKNNLDKVPALGYKKDGGYKLNSGLNSLVSQEEMDELMPGYAWDLLPYKEKPLDLYRSHNWHPRYNESKMTPFAAIYTSLGCNFKCSFCCINTINRTSTNDNDTAADFAGMRFWSTKWVKRQFDKLLDLGVTTIRVSDELFLFNKRHYEPILDYLIESQYGKHIDTWYYSRVDTVNTKFLEKLYLAGNKWLALGIEAANQEIRQEITKGKFREVNIREVVKWVESTNMDVVSNFIFGFPNEKIEHLQQTLNLAKELNTCSANFYAATALPGSPLYWEAVNNGWELPESYSGYGFLSYDHLPLRTHYLTASEVLSFRDSAWHEYYERPELLSKIENKFGTKEKQHIQKLCKIKLKRKILENAN